MARRKASLAERVDAGYFQKTEDVDAGALPESPNSSMERKKRTYYLPADVLMLLREIQLQRFRETGEEPELSDLVAEGIKRLAE